MKKPSAIFLFLCGSFCMVNAQQRVAQKTRLVNVADGWAGNSINTVIFRKNSLVTYQDTQFISFYDNNGYVIIGKRKLGDSNWQLKKTTYKGNIKDAHNCISIALDGDGYLHMAWDHHNNQLHYCKSIAPLSLELTTEIPMTGEKENKVAYPEFYLLPNGDLLFFYRDGSSGNGNLAIKSYDSKTKQWAPLQSNLVDGETKRNAYWQACVDAHGDIHLAWVWRESPDVASNHDMCYAVSKDGGLSWQKSTGEKYQLPITMATAEVIAAIPQNSELINQTSICTNADGDPFIATYFKEKNDVPQYHLIYREDKNWVIENMRFRKTGFSLSGVGTKKIPVSRPQVIGWGGGNRTNIAMIFRDEERGNKVSIASKRVYKTGAWLIENISDNDVGAWEPTFDIPLWNKKRQLHLFVERVSQADSEGVENTAAQIVQVLEYGF